MHPWDGTGREISTSSPEILDKPWKGEAGGSVPGTRQEPGEFLMTAVVRHGWARGDGHAGRPGATVDTGPTGSMIRGTRTRRPTDRVDLMACAGSASNDHAGREPPGAR